jgi:hypothetical protein
MRIISDYKDYYDSLQDYDSIVWDRKYLSITETDSTFKELANKLDLIKYARTSGNVKDGFLHIIPVILGFCGNYFKYKIEIHNNDSFQVLLTDDFFYLKNKFTYELIDMTLDNDLKSYFAVSYYNLDISFLNNINLFVRYNSPILLIHPLVKDREKGYKDFNIIVNPSLKKLGYHKKKDIQQVYQELDMFISGVLTNKEDRPELEEKHRKGSRFDKYSFRRLPEKC